MNLGKSYIIHSIISPPHLFPVPPIGQTLLHRKDIKVGRTQSLCDLERGVGEAGGRGGSGDGGRC